jgi:hypothetical protein
LLVATLAQYFCCWCVAITGDAELRRDPNMPCRITWYAERDPGRVVIASTMNVDPTRILPVLADLEPQSLAIQDRRSGRRAARELSAAGYPRGEVL